MCAPLIDARDIFLKAKANQDRRRAAKNKKAKEQAGSKEKPVEPTYEKCVRQGCKNERRYSGIGLCQSCYEQLARQADKHSEKYGQRDAILTDHKFKRGETCLISEQHPNPEYRGLYATVVDVEDGGAVVLVRLTGDSTNEHTSSRIKRMRDSELRVVCTWLLKVDDDDDDQCLDDPAAGNSELDSVER